MKWRWRWGWRWWWDANEMKIWWGWGKDPGNDVKLIRCVLNTTLDISVVNCPGHDGWTAAMLALSGVWMRLCQVKKPSAGKGVVGLFSWHGLHFENVLQFVRCITVTVSPNQIIMKIRWGWGVVELRMRGGWDEDELGMIWLRDKDEMMMMRWGSDEDEIRMR